MKLLRLIDEFEDGHLCEVYELPNGKILIVEDEGGVVFLGDRSEYDNWRKKRTSERENRQD